jgi:hypothetical protein
MAVTAAGRFLRGAGAFFLAAFFFPADGRLAGFTAFLAALPALRAFAAFFFAAAFRELDFGAAMFPPGKICCDPMAAHTAAAIA